MISVSSFQSKPLKGTITIPGDKSISHRSIMLGGLAVGETTVHNLLESEDVHATINAMRAFGCRIEQDSEKTWHIHGVGVGGLHEPDQPLDMGNSGTSTRLLMGIAGSHNIATIFSGDASLSKRPMGRVITPLEMMGATVTAREGGKLPLTIKGPDTMMSIEYALPVASAQVKSCVLLAGLNAAGRTTVIETVPTRDYTETMLEAFGVPVHREGSRISIDGYAVLKPTTIIVPADPSSAAFFTVAACIVPGSDIVMPNVGVNTTRIGLYESLIEMGADIRFESERMELGQKVADIHVRYTDALQGIEIPPERVPSMIDEFPIFAVAASFARSQTIMTGLEELRVKESDRLAVTAKGLAQNGINIEEGADSLIIKSSNQAPNGGGTVQTALDHRIAMSFLVLGMGTQTPVTIDDATPIDTSFPGFIDMINANGGLIE